MMYNNWMWGGGFGFGWIFMILIWALIIWVIIMLVRKATGHEGCCGHGNHNGHKPIDSQTIASGKQENSALRILNERYAKGEINKQEYEEKKKDLTG